MFYFWYIYLYSYYIKNIWKIQRVLKPLKWFSIFVYNKIFRKIQVNSIQEFVIRKLKTNSKEMSILIFFMLAINLSMVLSKISGTFHGNLLADTGMIVEAVDLDTVNSEQSSINDISVDSYDYYQNMNMEVKSEDFLDLYLIEDKNFLLRSVDLKGTEIDISHPDRIITYIVKSGDNLEKIAKQFDINVETIRTANSLKKNIITPGQELVILPISGIYYTIKKGDTLSKIAVKYKISASVIREYNNLEDDSLKVNDKIILPGAKDQIIVKNTQTISSETKITENSDSGSSFIYPTVGWNWGTAHGNSNNAVDIANACGTPIYASSDGIVITVKTSGYNSGYGLYVKIQHNNGISTLYAHLSQILVNDGQYVSKGQMIGKMGTTGKSTGCHLHFEVFGCKNPFIKK